MKWPIALLTGYVLLALESPVREALRLGPSGASPSLLLPFVVFVALFGSPPAALWNGLLIGLAVDLTTFRGEAATAIAGPYALAYAAAAYFVLSTRSMVVRRSPITLPVMSILASLVAALVVTVIFAIRRTLWGGAWADGFGGALGSDLWRGIVGSLYTGATGLFLAAILLPLQRFYGFQD